MEEQSEKPSDFGQIDAALFSFQLELYASLHAHNAATAQTANKMFQFLGITTAAFGVAAINFLTKGDFPNLILCAAILLMLPLAIYVIFLIWLREQLRLLRNSVFLHGLERRISEFVELMQPILQTKSNVQRRVGYIFVQRLFGSNFLDWENWVRGTRTGRNLEEKEIYAIILVVFLSAAVGSALLGMSILTIAYDQGCLVQEGPPTGVTYPFIIGFLKTGGNGFPFFRLHWPRECVFSTGYDGLTILYYIEILVCPPFLFFYTRNRRSVLQKLGEGDEGVKTASSGSKAIIEGEPEVEGQVGLF